MAVAVGKTSQEMVLNLSLGSAIKIDAAGTKLFPLFETHRAIDFRGIRFLCQSTSVSGVPATNHVALQIWNVTDATKVAAATISGTTSGTLLTPNKSIAVATRAQMLGPGSTASANKVFQARVITTGTLSANIKNPRLNIVTDYID